MSNMGTGFIGWHVLQEGMYYWEICDSAGHFFHVNMLWQDMSYKIICLIGGHVLWKVKYCGGMSYGRLYLTRVQVLQ